MIVHVVYSCTRRVSVRVSVRQMLAVTTPGVGYATLCNSSGNEYENLTQNNVVAIAIATFSAPASLASLRCRREGLRFRSCGGGPACVQGSICAFVGTRHR